MDHGELASFAADHEAPLLAYAFLLTGSHQEAQDLVQGAFLRLLKRVPYRIASPAAYVRRMIYNDYCSRLRRDRIGERPSTREVLDTPSFDDDVVRRAWMWAELGELPTRQRAVLVLRYYEGLHDADIALILGCRRSTVRSLAARSLHTLRNRIDNPTLEPEDIAGRER